MKILYLMHVDWCWAKQRPHFVAEHLSKYFDVTVSHSHSFRKNSLSHVESKTPVNIRKFFVLPFSRYKFVALLNNYLAKRQLLPLLKKADIVWVTHPVMFGLIKDELNERQHLVYDCMDDALEFPEALRNKQTLNHLKSLETDTVDRSNTLFCSSSYLKSKLASRYNCKKNIHVVNNAISLPDEEQKFDSGETNTLNIINRTPGVKIIYIGTISSWFDFELILNSLNNFKQLTWILVGPCEILPPTHERLIILPAVSHRLVFPIMRAADALAMPFKLNELIRSVNPVKVYEYIYAQKPALVISYQETEKFKEHVYLYQTQNDFFEYIKLLVSCNLPKKSSSDDSNIFLKNNTWGKRVHTMTSILGHN